MKPAFSLLSRSYPLKKLLDRPKLYDQLGWSDLTDKPAFQDTCAIRMSIALNAAGVPVAGWLKIKSGPLKGKNVEPSQAKLSQWLKRQWGQPEVYKNDDYALHGIGNRTGIVSIWGINLTPQGHIDLVSPDGKGFHTCAMQCPFFAREIWFWPLQ